jgi:arylsulfatase
VETLRRLNLDDRTVILFTSDNGPWLSENKNRGDGTLPGDRGGSAGPLRSGKVTTWEGGIRVPTVVWAPKRVPAGATCNAIASTLDVMPTFAKLAGAKTPDDRVIDGEDISDLLAGRIDRANPEKTFFGYLHAELQTVRQGKWKLHLPSPEGYPVKNRHIAPADERTFRQPQLFDLETDLGEKKNVANQHPDVVEWLTKLAERARADIGDFDRLGQGARFFDEGPRRPDVGKPKRL